MAVQFTLFSSLPQELRLKIWRSGLTPRVVEICQKNDHGYDEDLDTSNTGPPSDLYSPTALPVFLKVNQESRDVVLRLSLPDFPTSSNAQRIYYNPDVDSLYFPAWCFRNNIQIFEDAVSDEVKGRIRKVVLDNLMWMSAWDDDTINDQITIREFTNIDELIFTTRDLKQCGCCISFRRPEEGEVEFVEIEDGHDATSDPELENDEEDRDSEAEMNQQNDETRRRREREALGIEEEEPQESNAVVRNKYSFVQEYVRRINEQFESISKTTEGWNVPKARFVRLKRGGEFP